MKQKVDIKIWDRFKPYNFFKTFDNPYASVTSIINVDNIVRLCKEYKISFYGLMTYMVLKTINELDSFKYVQEGDDVYKYDCINVSCTVLKNNNGLNFTRIIEYSDFSSFMTNFINAKIEAESDVGIPYIECYNKVYITCVPWIRITSVENPMKYNVCDSVPRICWGKYFLQNNEYYIDLSLQVNHAFQDGYHMGLFFQRLEENILNFGQEKIEYKGLVRRLG